MRSSAELLQLALLLWLPLLYLDAQDPTSELFDSCCRQGDTWGSLHGHEGCRNMPINVNPGDQSLCVEVTSICCQKKYRTIACQRGRAAAKSGRDNACLALPAGVPEAFKDCCDGCKLGIAMAAKGGSCETLEQKLSCPWAEPARQCCLEDPRHGPITDDNDLEQARNRCDTSPRQCSQLCRDPGPSLGAVQCSCLNGYRLAPDRKQCTDVDECAENRDNCDPHRETCLNSPGSFHCVENEASVHPDHRNPPPPPPFPPHPIHGNTVPSEKCPIGYILNKNNTHKVCDDLDECTSGPNPCEPRSERCVNTVGSFTCQPDNNIGDQVQPLCPPGFKHQIGQGCVDVDECVESLDDCDFSSTYCLNIYGSFQCQPRISRSCPAGYKYLGSTCTDVDECAEDLHACQAGEETCRNTGGGYVCDPACPDGTQLRKDTGQCEAAPSIDSQVPLKGDDYSCPAGYKHVSPSNKACIDVDECQEDLHFCDPSQERCQNSLGSFECLPLRTEQTTEAPPRTAPPPREPTCARGLRYDPTIRNCKDVDECAEGRHECDTSYERCHNTQGSYRCQQDHSKTQRCEHGFVFDAVSGGCRDVDECQAEQSPCSSGSICTNLRGTYRCDASYPGPGYPTPSRNESTSDYCRKGYEWNPQSRSCVDVDECRDRINPCPNSRCENTVGSFHCGCASGLTLDPVTKTCSDLNECQLGLHNCLPTQRCDNTVGSFVCVRITSCGTGYTVNIQTGVCEDDDECSLRPTSICGREFICRNTLGSFRCDRLSCSAGERLLPDGSCKAADCPPGTKHTALGNCGDIDECATGEARCRHNQRCVNTQGSYTCQSLLICGGGYEADQYGNQCLDVDECVEGSHECASNQICKNRQGGYACECPTGFSLDSQRTCVDVDECSRFSGQVCSISSECQNTVGSYLCECKPGFSKASVGQTCSDVDECRDNPNLCQHTCINTWGGYQCTCRAGFTIGADNRSCADVDECSLYKGKGNLCIGFCVNQPGSFSCSCPDGYRLGGDQRTCQDINECQELGVCAGEDQVCLNTRGGYKCSNISCPPNYVRDKEHRNKATGVCRKKCRPGDQDCLNDPTQSISHQGVALPSLPELPQPIPLSTMRLTGSSSGQPARPIGQNFVILEGNDQRYFDMQTGDGVGYVRLIRPILGPQELLLKVLMEARIRRKLSRHLLYINVDVSPYAF